MGRTAARPDVLEVRPQSSDDIAGATIRLSSRAFAYLTRAVLPAAGGLTTLAHSRSAAGASVAAVAGRGCLSLCHERAWAPSVSSTSPV